MASARVLFMLLCVAGAMQLSNACVTFVKGIVDGPITSPVKKITLNQGEFEAYADLQINHYYMIGAKVTVCNLHNLENFTRIIFHDFSKFIVRRGNFGRRFEVQVEIQPYYTFMNNALPALPDFDVLTDGYLTWEVKHTGQ